MAYDEGLAHRLRELLEERRDVTEKAMFGGLAFLVGGNMSVAASRTGELLVRVGAQRHDAALARPHTRIMEFPGRPMKGWIYVDPAGIESDAALAEWVELGVAGALASEQKPLRKSATPSSRSRTVCRRRKGAHRP